MIQFKNVTFSYSNDDNGCAGVDSINLTIPKGQCVLLCGASGCGKSTLLKLMNGLIPHYIEGSFSGAVQVDGKNVAQTSLYELSHSVGTVFQNPKTQFFNTDVDSEIVFGAENHGVEPDVLKKRLEETFSSLQLEKLRGRNIFELSGGEKQKVAFASVYHMNPDLFLLDEPSSNLDAGAIHDLNTYLHQLKSEGKTVVIAEHRLYYCMDIADRIVYLKNGKIQQDLTISQFRALSQETRINMGLRAAYMNQIPLGEKKVSPVHTVLQAEHLTVKRKKQTILRDVSFTAGIGEIIGITGKNGAGKTTLLRTLCGLHREYDGTILWNHRPAKDKQRCQQSYMVMQDVNYQLFAESVQAECSFGMPEISPQLVQETLSQLNLAQVQTQHPNTLSGGQKQRLAVAVSMVCGKKVLVFDEPTSGLDLDNMQRISNLIQALSRQAIVFVVTHDYEFLCRTCTRYMYLAQGNITLDLPVCLDTELQLQNCLLE